MRRRAGERAGEGRELQRRVPLVTGHQLSEEEQRYMPTEMPPLLMLQNPSHMLYLVGRGVRFTSAQLLGLSAATAGAGEAERAYDRAAGVMDAAWVFRGAPLQYAQSLT